MNSNQETRCSGVIHVIKDKETLYQVAQDYNVTVRDIMRQNPFVNIYNLQIGDELCIPTTKPVIGGAFVPYVVKEGDTLQSILSKQNLTYEKLARANKKVGMLTLPVGTVLLIDKEK
ncbi:MAG: LysM domain-containing protein [Anaerostipes sp.]|nr:LysM domain-containing protein [Anaerostipes sp.]MDD3744933.1 LysM domain-containing protein [Anaerostipes sp.]